MIMTSLAMTPNAKAGDTPNNWFTSIPNAPVGVTFNDVAWNSDGTYACFVGTDAVNAQMYWYNPAVTGAAAWTHTLKAGGSLLNAQSLNRVAWDPMHGGFIAMTGGDAVEYWYNSSRPGFATERLDSELKNFRCMNIVYDLYNHVPYSRFYAVGAAYSSTGATCMELNLNTLDWTMLTTTGYGDEEWDGVAVDPATHDLLIVGQSTAGGYGYYFKFYRSNSTLQDMISTMNLPAYFSDIVYDQSSGDMLLSCSVHGGPVVSAIYRLIAPNWGFSLSNNIGSIPSTTTLNDIKVDSNGRAIAVGYDDNAGIVYGRVYDIWRDSGNKWRLAQRSDTTSIFYTEHLSGVSIRPIGQPCALVSGSAFKYAYTSAASNIEVDTLWPHISYIDLYDAGTTNSRLNSQVDVDPGTSTTSYDLVVRAWHGAGQAAIGQIDVVLWWDGGSEIQPAPFVTPGFENQRMMFQWLRGSPDTWQQLYPTAAPYDETSLIIGACTHIDEPDLFNVTVRFRFSPHQQVRFADGLAGNFMETAGTRYGGGAPEGQSTPSALDRLNSWNIHVTTWDTSANQASAYDEFGFYRYTYIGTSGLPGGGNVVGSGPPNSMVTLLPFSQNINYSANCPYQLTVSTTDLTGMNHGGNIPSNRTATTGGQINVGTYFTGPGIPQYYFGSAAPAYLNPRNSQRTTTTVTAGGNVVSFYCDIPSVVEDYYKGTLTYSVVHG